MYNTVQTLKDKMTGNKQKETDKCTIILEDGNKRKMRKYVEDFIKMKEFKLLHVQIMCGFFSRPYIVLPQVNLFKNLI